MDNLNSNSSWDSLSFNLGCVLHGWRCNRGYSLNDMAIYENVPRVALVEVEEGVGSMAMLLRYFDFIRCNEPSYLSNIFPAWVNMCGYSVNNL